MDWSERTSLLLTKNQFEKLRNSDVLIVGLGGVGAYAAEMICRAGVGKMTIIDGDQVQTSNLNRQLIALHSNVGKRKALLMGKRLLDINPELELNIIDEYIKDDRMIEILNHSFNYVVDAIDTLAPKVYLIYHTLQKKLPIVSSMGAGGKLDPLRIQVADISKSFNCNLARMIRKRLHKLNIYEGVTVVFSPEAVSKNTIIMTEGEKNKKSTVGTISYLPPTFGCVCASVVIKDLIGD